MKAILKITLTTLVVISEIYSVSAQKTSLMNKNCENTISRSTSQSGENGETPVVRTKPNEFNIIVNPKLKPVNFITSLERYYRSQTQKVDTSVFSLTILYWNKLSAAQKSVEIEQQRANNEERANTAHKTSNINQQLIYMVNNTNQDVALQMQDDNFIGVLEARVGHNEWRPVQYLTFSWCGNSYVLKHIAAGHKAYFITPALTGNYKTTLRYKILGKDQFYYSNKFKGRINYCDLYDTKHSPKEKLAAFVKYYIFE